MAINPHNPRSHADNQFLALFRANCVLVGAHSRIEVVFVRQRKNRYELSAMLHIIQENSPIVLAYMHSAQETVCPIVGMADAALIFKKQR